MIEQELVSFMQNYLKDSLGQQDNIVEINDAFMRLSLLDYDDSDTTQEKDKDVELLKMFNLSDDAISEFTIKLNDKYRGLVLPEFQTKIDNFFKLGEHNNELHLMVTCQGEVLARPIIQSLVNNNDNKNEETTGEQLAQIGMFGGRESQEATTKSPVMSDTTSFSC